MNINSSITAQTSLEPQRHRTPPLESGDRLTRHEFERRYAAATHIKKAELIEGVVNNMMRVLEVLQAGRQSLATPNFVEQLMLRRS